MSKLSWVTFADRPSPMGLQTYESSVMSALRANESNAWSFERRTVASLRATAAPDVRLPMGLLANASSGLATTMGRWAYRGAGVVHRFDLRLPPASVPEVVTVHDLPPLRFADEGSIASWSLETVKRARAVITPSAFAAQEITTLLGVSNTVVIPNGVRPDIAQALPLTEEERRALGMGSPRYVLHAGGATERKNLNGLAGAWRLLAPVVPDCELVLAGPQDARRDAAFDGLPRVRKLGFRPHDHVSRLMAGAACVVVPSTYEGFGLPALEAMAVGAPVVAADRGALPEVCGEAALLCEPDAQAIAEALERMLADVDLRAKVTAAGRRRAADYTWERSAAKHLDVYDRYLR